MTIEEMAAKLKEMQEQQTNSFAKFQSELDTQKKDFTLKLESANKDSAEWKTLAVHREEELRQFKEKSEKDRLEKEKMYREAQEKETIDFVEASIKEGKIVPAQKDMVCSIMKSLTSEGTVMEFTDKDGAVKKHSQLSLFKAFIASLKKAIHYGEFSISGGNPQNSAPDHGADTPVFMQVRREGTVENMQVDGADIDAKANAYMQDKAKLGQVVSYEDALIAVSPKQLIE